jgi:hypothetical protein
MIFDLLGCYTAQTGSYRRFGINYVSHLQGSKGQRRTPLKTGTLGCPETSVSINIRCVTSKKS